jgi:hypothetical protein
VFEDKFIRQVSLEHFGSLPKALESMSVAKIPNGVGHKPRRGVFVGNKQAAHGPTDLLTYLPEAHLRGTRGGDRTVDGHNNLMQEPQRPSFVCSLLLRAVMFSNVVPTQLPGRGKHSNQNTLS